MSAASIKNAPRRILVSAFAGNYGHWTFPAFESGVYLSRLRNSVLGKASSDSGKDTLVVGRELDDHLILRTVSPISSARGHNPRWCGCDRWILRERWLASYR